MPRQAPISAKRIARARKILRAGRHLPTIRPFKWILEKPVSLGPSERVVFVAPLAYRCSGFFHAYGVLTLTTQRLIYRPSRWFLWSNPFFWLFRRWRPKETDTPLDSIANVKTHSCIRGLIRGAAIPGTRLLHVQTQAGERQVYAVQYGDHIAWRISTLIRGARR